MAGITPFGSSGRNVMRPYPSIKASIGEPSFPDRFKDRKQERNRLSFPCLFLGEARKQRAARSASPLRSWKEEPVSQPASLWTGKTVNLFPCAKRPSRERRDSVARYRPHTFKLPWSLNPNPSRPALV